MTALTVAPAPAVRPVPWRRLAWVAWRRQRTTVLTTVAVLVVVGIYLAISGVQIHRAYAAWEACAPRAAATCQFQFTNFEDSYGSPGLLGFVQVLLPGLVGAFAGAPLLARELESGTFRYAWTQGVGRLRWAASLLIPGAVWSAAALGAFGALVAWRNEPLVAAGTTDRLEGSSFPATGMAAVGWTLAAFALGVFAGLIWRRVIPALATTIVIWFGLAVLASTKLRLHYLTPLTTTSVNPKGPASQSVADWWSKGGVRIDTAQLNHVLQAAGIQTLSRGHSEQAAPGSNIVDPFDYLARHGYTHVTSYQPDSRYWAFQWIEFGWLALLAVVSLAATFWLLRRRSA